MNVQGLAGRPFLLQDRRDNQKSSNHRSAACNTRDEAYGNQKKHTGRVRRGGTGMSVPEQGGPMRVLDLDLDFFLADCCPLAAPGERPAPAGCEPWPAAAVEAFLTRQCGLSAAAPVPGCVFETHDGALAFWRARMAEERLRAPFHVTHVDAHSDLGIGYPGPGYVLNGVLPQRPGVRPALERYYENRQLDEANYLLFALAFRWIASLDNVRNPRSRPDMPTQLYESGRRDRLRLSSFAAGLMESKHGPEPAVPYRVYEDYRAFSAGAPYDFVTLAISPRYTPAAADALIEPIRRFLRPVEGA